MNLFRALELMDSRRKQAIYICLAGWKAQAVFEAEAAVASPCTSGPMPSPVPKHLL